MISDRNVSAAQLKDDIPIKSWISFSTPQRKTHLLCAEVRQWQSTMKWKFKATRKFLHCTTTRRRKKTQAKNGSNFTLRLELSSQGERQNETFMCPVGWKSCSSHIFSFASPLLYRQLPDFSAAQNNSRTASGHQHYTAVNKWREREGNHMSNILPVNSEHTSRVIHLKQIMLLLNSTKVPLYETKVYFFSFFSPPSISYLQFPQQSPSVVVVARCFRCCIRT